MARLEATAIRLLKDYDLKGLLRELVAVPSTAGFEGALAEVIGRRLELIGMDVRYQTVQGSRKNVIGTYRFARPGRCLMFNGHTDTVDVSGPWTNPPHELTERDGRLYGLGAVDMKGGLAASLTAIQAIIAADLPLSGTLMFSGVIDEEGYSSGAKALLSEGMDEIDAIIIGEPRDGSEESPTPILTHGKVLYRLVVQGKQAHGFRPSEGINAVEEGARIVASLDRLRQTNHPDLGVGPLSTLKMTGGFAEYAVVVPDRCEIIISRMTVPGETSEQCKADMEQLVDSLGLKSKTTVEMVPPYYAPLDAPATDVLFEMFSEVLRQERGRTPCFGPSSIITDASVFCGEGGIPTLVYGPTGGGFHQADEYVEIESLEACARTYARLAVRYLNEEHAALDAEMEKR